LLHTEFVSKQFCWEPSLCNRFLFTPQKGWKDISNDKHVEVDAQQISSYFFVYHLAPGDKLAHLLDVLHDLRKNIIR